jgi:primosomal protein N' (replication factor Y)
MNDASVCIVQVALKIPFADTLDYQLVGNFPVDLIGCRVRVPLGKNKLMVGVIVDIKKNSHHKQLKAVDAVLDQQPLLNKNSLSLITRAAKYYQVSLGEMLMTALPAWLRKPDNPDIPQETWYKANVDAKTAKKKLEKAPKQWQVFDYIIQNGPQMPAALSHLSAGASALCKQLAAKGLLQQSDRSFIDNKHIEEPNFTLTDDQQHVLKHIQNNSDRFHVSLLDGITGSGKTEVYIRSLMPLLEKGQQALVLVPEIGLTPQLFQTFSKRIKGRLAVFHSGLSDGARARVWQQAGAGHVDVVVATRSGLFTPFQNLAMILVDEEHDLSYKQQDGVRYSARDLAVLRGKIENIPVILGSATPAFESLRHALKGHYHWLTLRSRTNQKALPKIQLQNLDSRKTYGGLTRQTLDDIGQQLDNNHQVLVFLNRRGWSPKLLCHDCGWIAECDDCDAYLTYHKHNNRLLCHHCRRHYRLPEFCPNCGSQEMDTLGVGTEQVETTLLQEFSQYPVIRFDRDSVSTPRQWQQQLDRVRNGDPCVIVGTQMLAKGHDFPKLSLVVVVNVDNSFYSTDFRAEEYLAQLLIQVAGRAGRAETSGQVIIQTHQPKHEFFHTLLQQGYEQLAKNGLEQRREMQFPPFSHMAIIRAQHRFEDKLEAFLLELVDAIGEHPDVSVMGPLPAPMQKKQKLHRMQLILNANNRAGLHQLLKQLLKKHHPTNGSVRWFIDIDPVSFD